MNNDSLRKFACVNCGTPYEAYPPNDLYNIALPNGCEEGDSIRIKYDCENCHQPNSIYWDKKHFRAVIASRRYRTQFLK